MPSLRKKILNTYGFSKLVLLIFATVVLVDLMYLERHIERGKVTTEFREAIQEMRREEKNLFLYRDRTSLERLTHQTDAARASLVGARDHLVTIGGEKNYRRLEMLLQAYRDDLGRYGHPARVNRASQDSLRRLGHELTEASQGMSSRERRLLTDATRRASYTLLGAFVGVVLLGIAGGLFLAHRVVRPLRELQAGLVAIDSGRARNLPLPSNDQEIQSFVTAFNDMLRHMRRQQDQTKRNEKVAALGVLVSGVAHELNNPLSNISTSAQLLLEEGGRGDAGMQQQWLAQIDSETERARRIVRRLLDSVRQPKLHVQRLSLSDLVQSSLQLVNRQLPPDVQVCIGTTAEMEIEVDRERLHQVFINLVKNAADAGARHITVQANESAWEDDLAEAGHLAGDPAFLREASAAVCIRVEDDGPGMTPEVREHIFDPFFTTRAAGDGTGLGLYLVEEIVSEHGGCILVDNPPSGGTRFSIWLPCNDAGVS